VNYVLDLDIRSFFDKVEHDHMEKFVRHRIGDERIVRLILKWMKAGVMEDGQWYETKAGTPQGAVVSPLLANLYLHYVLDVWVQAWRKKVAHGDVICVRYADDAVLGFQHREEAEKFLADLPERVRKFGLELHPDKTRLIEFGRYAAERRGKRGEGKPETFNFLGFTHICGKNHVTGYFMVYRKTIGKRMAAKLKKIRQQLRVRLHGRTQDTAEWLQSVVRGYFRYHAVPCNEARRKAFRHEVLRMWWWQLRRRSQRTRWTWNKFGSDWGTSYRKSRFCIRILTFALRGNTSEVRTVCVRSARTDLCGGCRVTGIPTATRAGTPASADEAKLVNRAAPQR
jgi:RNA-directed DNA polymerase